jgi:ABC-type transport system substrate-binding protein
LQQLIANLSVEGLLAFLEDGRPAPSLAEGWTNSPDGLLLTIQLRRQAKFHDGSAVTADAVVQSLKTSLPGRNSLGPAFGDIDQILALDSARVQIQLKKPSRLVIKALETGIRKPVGKTSVGTGPYMPSTSSNAPELRANPDYYQGRPAIERITITAYPSIRTAWAELLRGNTDMLYEVNLDALDSLQGSNDVEVLSSVRHYQYMIVFSSTAKNLRSPEIRRELNAAIDRDAVVHAALNGHGIPSTGPVPPSHWAFDRTAPRFKFDPTLAKRLAARHLQFTCLVAADSVYERIALVVKQQLAAASVDMRVVEAPQEQVMQTAAKNDFEALLGDFVSGPNLFRSYRHFHSKMPFNPKPAASALIDASLDRIRYAASDDEYRAGVTAFQQAVVDEPPAIFLAWGERARAVSRRFAIPKTEGGRDITAIRLWKPVAPQIAGGN